MADTSTERATCSNCEYWRSEMTKAVAKRDLREKEAFDSLDGGGKYWRNIAKITHIKLTRADFMLRGRELKLDEAKVEQENSRWAEIVAQAIVRDARIERAKSELWKVWSPLDKGDPMREAIRKVWEQL